MPDRSPAGRVPPTAILTVAFGSSVAMWTVGYFGRLPGLELPSPLLFLAILVCLPAGGLALARRGGASAVEGAVSGAITGALNLLVLGSFLGDAGHTAPGWILWLPGSLLASAALAALGVALAGRERPAPDDPRAWPGRFTMVAVAATLLLLGAGGLVTSAEAGLAVEDWPTSFGYNMFLYPFSRMTGGIYLEHAHRLIGALVGLTTVALALVVQRTDDRRFVRGFAWTLVVAVIIQGGLGGIRVTERSLALALGHGILAQLFFAGLVLLASWTSAVWRQAGPRRGVWPSAPDRVWGTLLVGLLVTQAALGAAQRHFGRLLLVHVLFGIAFVIPLALRVAIRTMSLRGADGRIRRLGAALGLALAVQVTLGFAAWVATSAVEAGTLPRAFDLVLATAHQWFGAVLLATAVLCEAWAPRLATRL